MTAAERAADIGARYVYRPDAEFIVADLMADPDLLVDLAIEAGALEQVNYVGGVVETVVLEEALYRRTTQENGR